MLVTDPVNVGAPVIASVAALVIATAVPVITGALIVARLNPPAVVMAVVPVSVRVIAGTLMLFQVTDAPLAIVPLFCRLITVTLLFRKISAPVLAGLLIIVFAVPPTITGIAAVVKTVDPTQIAP